MSEWNDSVNHLKSSFFWAQQNNSAVANQPGQKQLVLAPTGKAKSPYSVANYIGATQ